MSLCTIENICQFTNLSNWTFDLADSHLSLKKHKDDANNTIAIMLVQDLLLNRSLVPNTDPSPLLIDFSVSSGYKLSVISCVSNGRFLEVYNADDSYLHTSRGAMMETNKNLFEHEIAFTLPDLRNYRLKFLSLKPSWKVSEEEKAGDAVIRELKLMFEQTGPVNTFSSDQNTSQTPLLNTCTTTQSNSSSSEAMAAEIASLRQEITTLKNNAPVPSPVASILQSDAAILTMLSALQGRLVREFSVLLEQKLAPIAKKLETLEIAMLTIQSTSQQSPLPSPSAHRDHQSKYSENEGIASNDVNNSSLEIIDHSTSVDNSSNNNDNDNSNVVDGDGYDEKEIAQ